MSEIEPIVGYCVRCKEKREIADVQAVFTDAARPAARGRCPECGTAIFRFGATPLHEGMTPPEPKPSASGAKKGRGKRKSKRKKVARKPARRKRLVIVESPAKARTIGRFLGSDYEVHASLGHVRDLLKSRLSVDVEQDFEPTYRVPQEKKEVVKEISGAADRAREIWLATDPDREGEAIAWHLMEAAGMPPERVRRVVFHEITRQAVEEAFAHPRDLDMKLVDAQQARRILDRLVGFNLSPLLWKKVRGRLSAGRVQSVALRMVVEREEEIRAFDTVEYWSVGARLAQSGQGKSSDRPEVSARLHRVAGEEPHLPDETTTMGHVSAIEGARYVVTQLQQNTRRRSPGAPFTTSTLQQEASRRLGFRTQRTMSVAQSLYEGINIGDEGTVGLITYMRTDSVNVSREAAEEARRYVAERYGAEFVPDEIPTYKTRAKKAQEAHEAIRPTSVARSPDQVKKFLDKSQARLYDLIWRRFVASQMESALVDQTKVDLVPDLDRRLPAGSEPADETQVAALAGDPRYLFRASGSVVRFPGYLSVYEENKASKNGDEGGELPALAVGELLDELALEPKQHFTQPPPRYSDASLVRALEENGIGRPSTYAPIVNTITSRGYVTRDGRRLVPTELGEIVLNLLVEHFPDVLNINFTAQMEDELDEIATGERSWPSVLHDFYTPFNKRLQTAQQKMERVELAEELAGEKCEKCGRDMVIRFGRFGKFIACPGFPECRNTKPFLELIGVTCPDCGGDLVEKRTKGGRLFYGCSTFPECDFSSWKRPVPQPCPACGGTMVIDNKTFFRCLRCEERTPREQVADVVETA